MSDEAARELLRACEAVAAVFRLHGDGIFGPVAHQVRAAIARARAEAAPILTAEAGFVDNPPLTPAQAEQIAEAMRDRR